MTVLFVLLSLPYTFVLLTFQWLYKISHYCAMSWVQRLKPFFDAYTGPYKANHRYWTGLLLTARIVILITFSVNWSNNPSVISVRNSAYVVQNARIGSLDVAAGVDHAVQNTALVFWLSENVTLTCATCVELVSEWVHEREREREREMIVWSW